MKLERNIAYYAEMVKEKTIVTGELVDAAQQGFADQLHNVGEIVETGKRPENIPYPICDVMFDKAGNALRSDTMIGNDEPYPIDIDLTAHFRDVIDNHPDCRAVRPIYANVTFSTIANAWPDDGGYHPVLNGVIGRKVHSKKYGHVVEFGTRPESIPESIPGMIFDVFGNVLKPGNDSNDTTTPLAIDTAMTARVRQYYIDNPKEA